MGSLDVYKDAAGTVARGYDDGDAAALKKL